MGIAWDLSRLPSEPEQPSGWALDLSAASPGEDVVALGADLEPATVLAAYRAGMFPMPAPRGVVPRRALRAGARPVVWYSPDPRAVLPLDGLRVSRTLRRSARRLEVRVDSAFEEVVAACGDPRRPGAWIDQAMVRAYQHLHELRIAHSVETWLDGELVGGLFGLAVDGLFAGESMFHRATDASKVALLALVELLRDDGDERRLLDVQWLTPHLASLGCVEVPRADYLARLEVALAAPPLLLGPGTVPDLSGPVP